MIDCLSLIHVLSGYCLEASFRFNYFLAFHFGKNKDDGRCRSAALSVTLLSVIFSGDVGKMSLRRHTDVDATSCRRLMPFFFVFHSFFPSFSFSVSFYYYSCSTTTTFLFFYLPCI